MNDPGLLWVQVGIVESGAIYVNLGWVVVIAIIFGACQ